MAERIVVTPGGPRPLSLVHQVATGHALNVGHGQLRLVNLSDGVVSDVAKVAVRPEEVPALGSGWITYAAWTNNTGTPISAFRTTWQVPPDPTTQSGQLIYLFNAIEPAGGAAILQPVLQWGASGFPGAGDGPYWTVASWYVDSSGHAFFTPHVRVNPGDVLVGVITLTGHAGSSYNYNCEFQGIAGTLRQLQNSAELVWSTETLEAYRVNQCSDYPATDQTAFRAISIQTGAASPTPQWTVQNRITDCGQHTLIAPGNLEVDIYYREWHYRMERVSNDISSIAAIGDRAGRLHVFMRGSHDGHLYSRHQTAPNAESWTESARISNDITGPIAVAEDQAGRLQVFIIGSNDNHLYTRRQTASGADSWTESFRLSYDVTAVEAVRDQGSHLHVFVRGRNDGHLYHNWQLPS
jgi:hypothetical protein